MEVFPNWTSIPIVLFLIILTYILNRTFFIPMGRMLEDRHRRIEGARKEAEDIRKTSANRIAEFDKKMREARREAGLQMAQVKNEALSEKGTILSSKREEAEKMLAEARADIQRKTEEAREKLDSESKMFALEIASQILKRPIQGKQA